MFELWLKRVVISLIAASVLLYLADRCLFQLRGRPRATLACPQVLAVPLKGDLTEYAYQGTVNLDCAQALFPQGNLPSCWYLRRQAQQLMRY